MSTNQLSKRLESYLEKVEHETSKPIKIVESNDLGIKGMLSAFRYDPQFIIIIIKAGVPRFESDMIRSIAHEATHGLLIFKKGYCRPRFYKNISDQLIKNTRLVFTMLDDIVVNKIIEDNGFPPYGSEYIPSVIRETEAALKGENIYSPYSGDQFFHQIFKTSRLVIDWAFLEYYNLDKSHQKLLKDFLHAFKRNFPQEYQLGMKITQIISKQDIFNSQGHADALIEILNLWGLNQILELECHLDSK